MRVVGNEGGTDERHCTELDFTPSSLQPLRKYGALTSFVPRDFAKCKWLPLLPYAKWKKRLNWHDCRNVCTLEICCFLIFERYLIIYHYHYHKHQGLDPLIRPISRVTTVLANVSSVFQLFFFLVVCGDMISKGFGLVAFFASVKASSVCIHLSCLVCIQSVIQGVRSLLFCGHEGCSLPEVSITSFLPLQFFVSVRLSESNFLTHIKM